MNIFLLSLLLIPIFLMIFWIDKINKDKERKIRDLRRLIYKINDKVSQKVREERRER